MRWKLIEESGKDWQPPGVEPRTPLAWAISALPLSHDSQTTTNPHNPLYVLHRTPQLHDWQPLSMCCFRAEVSWVRLPAIAGLFQFPLSSAHNISIHYFHVRQDALLCVNNQTNHISLDVIHLTMTHIIARPFTQYIRKDLFNDH